MTAAVQDRIVRLVPAPATGLPDRSGAEDQQAYRSARLQAAWAAHPAGGALRNRPSAPVSVPTLAVVEPFPATLRNGTARRLRTGIAFVASWASALGAVAVSGPVQHVLEATAVGVVLVAALDRRRRTEVSAAGPLHRRLPGRRLLVRRRPAWSALTARPEAGSRSAGGRCRVPLGPLRGAVGLGRDEQQRLQGHLGRWCERSPGRPGPRAVQRG